MNRAEKQSEIDLLTGNFAKAQIALCADPRGLKVKEVEELRRGLKKSGCAGRVVKNTLAKISIDKAFQGGSRDEIDRFKGLFAGPSMLVLAYGDPVASSKLVADFSKAHKNFEIKGGWFEGKFVAPDGVKALASMPSREELLSQLLRVISAPATQLVRLLAAPATQVVRVVDEHRKNLEKGASAAA